MSTIDDTEYHKRPKGPMAKEDSGADKMCELQKNRLMPTEADWKDHATGDKFFQQQVEAEKRIARQWSHNEEEASNIGSEKTSDNSGSPSTTSGDPADPLFRNT